MVGWITYFSFIFFIIGSLCIAQVNYKITPVITGLNYPWAMAILPDNTMLITQKPGSIRIVKDNILLDESLKGVPAVSYKGQGGLLDICLHPNFSQNKWVYLSYSKDIGGYNKLVVTRYKLEGLELVDPKDIFVSNTKRKTALHHGARLLFINQNRLLISSGDGYSYMKKAQELDTHFGKIVSVSSEGNIPTTNPYFLEKGVLSDIYTYGHRNPQGFAYDVERNIIYSHEHGPKGGDELNIIEPGNNYGWPEITYGIDYSGRPISAYTHKKGMEQPLYYWSPSIALSSMILYEHDYFSSWKNCLFITGLKSRDVRRLSLKNNNVILEERLFGKLGLRWRYITVAKTGELYLLEDAANATLYKVELN